MSHISSYENPKVHLGILASLRVKWCTTESKCQKIALNDYFWAQLKIAV